MSNIPRSLAVVACVSGALSFLSCGGGDRAANPSPPTTLSPAPAPGPTPSTTPTPGATSPKSCGGPAPTGGPCGSRPDPQLATVLAQAFDEVRGHSDIFYPDGVTIRYLDKARAQLIAALDARGICGIFDYGNQTGDEIYIRTADARISEAYDVLSGTGQLRVGYQNSCEPAGSPPDPLPSYGQEDPQCTLAPSRDSFCLGRNFESEYEGDVRSSLVALFTERPELFDMKDSLNSELSYRLLDPKAYTSAMVGKMHAKGYCAMEDEELLVKRDNSMSENFDIVRSPGDREGQYSLFSYKGRCHNSTF